MERRDSTEGTMAICCCCFAAVFAGAVGTAAYAQTTGRYVVKRLRHSGAQRTDVQIRFWLWCIVWSKTIEV